MHIDHLHGGELFQHAARRQSGRQRKVRLVTFLSVIYMAETHKLRYGKPGKIDLKCSRRSPRKKYAGGSISRLFRPGTRCTFTLMVDRLLDRRGL